MNTELSKLDRMLTFHDWYYDYSDDHRAWCKGRDERSAINSELNRLKTLGLGDEAVALYTKHAPKKG